MPSCFIAVSVAGSVKMGISSPKMRSKFSMLIGVPSFSWRIRCDSDGAWDSENDEAMDEEAAVRKKAGSLILVE
jgi:hypothetical protein